MSMLHNHTQRPAIKTDTRYYVRMYHEMQKRTNFRQILEYFQNEQSIASFVMKCKYLVIYYLKAQYLKYFYDDC